ncbi:MAG: flagellar protein FlbB [Spirochaetaceae bacterium]|jgi:flagellar protein FlbB|nr:flagellar protein FlbB [Spirochaetaceae bacterium]
MARGDVGKSFLLLFLIILMSAGGLLWFDYLNVIDIKTFLAPVYRRLGLEARSQPTVPKGEMLNLDAERLAVRLETLDLREMEMRKQESDIQTRQAQIEQMSAELEDRQKGLDERENSINALAEEAVSRDRNIEQSARYLNGMPPQNAVAIIEAMDDQSAIDVIRKVEDIAKAEGAASIVSYWFSLLPPERAAAIQRKMSIRP